MANVQRGLITRDDVAHWDGVTRTSSRVDATGGTVTGLNFGDAIDILQVFGSGTSRTVATINDAVSRLGGATATLLFSTGTWVIDADITIPSTITCHVPAGSVFAVSSGQTLTFSGFVNVEYPPSWFSGAGVVTVSIEGSHFGTYHQTAAELSASVTPVNFKYPPGNVLRYGTNTTPGTTDMTTAIQNAHLVSTSGDYNTVVFPGGNYLFTTLTWSPHVRAITEGKVYLRTANASGRTIQISDEYGLPALFGLNSQRNFIFDGQFHVHSTNGSNTATAWSFGGATTANYCALATALRGVETRGFHGGVFEFRNNAFLLSFVDCFEWGCNGSVIVIADPITNSGEGLRFIDTTFGTGTGYLIDINTTDAISVDFIGCSCDYKLGMNQTGNTSPLTAINWIGGHLEWDTVAAAYLTNDATMTYNIDGAYIITTATTGFNSIVISETTGVAGNRTNFINCKYAMPGGTNIWHNIGANARGTFDQDPDVAGGGSATTFLNADAAAVIGRNGIPYAEGAWTPVLTFATPGDLSVAYSAQTGRYTRVGRMVTVFFSILTSTFTHSTASGNVEITGLPLTNAANDVDAGMGSSTGWALANYTDLAARVQANTTTIKVMASGTGQAVASLTTAEMASGGTVQFYGQVTYFLS